MYYKSIGSKVNVRHHRLSKQAHPYQTVLYFTLHQLLKNIHCADYNELTRMIKNHTPIGGFATVLSMSFK